MKVIFILVDNQSGEQKRMTNISPVAVYAWKDETTLLFPAVRNEKVKEEVKNGEERKTYMEAIIKWFEKYL